MVGLTYRVMMISFLLGKLDKNSRKNPDFGDSLRFHHHLGEFPRRVGRYNVFRVMEMKQGVHQYLL